MVVAVGVAVAVGAAVGVGISPEATNEHPRAGLQPEKETCRWGGGLLAAAGGISCPCPGLPCPQSLAAITLLSLVASRVSAV